MKKSNSVFFFIFFTLICHSSYGQKTNFGIGYNIGTHTKAEGLDYVIKRYNETRPWLDTKMESPGFFRGMSYSMDIYFPKGIMSFEWVGRKSDVWGRGLSATGEMTRDVRYKVNSWNWGLGTKLGVKRSNPAGAYVGFDFGLIRVKNYTRVYKTNENIPPYEKVNSRFSFDFSPFIQFTGARFTTKIYYQIMLAKVRFEDLNMRINPNTWFNDDYESTNGRTSSLGIAMRYNLFSNLK